MKKTWKKFGMELGVEWKHSFLLKLALIFLLMIGISLYAKISIFYGLGCFLLYLLANCFVIQLPKRANSIWFCILVVLSSIFTEQLVQWMLLDAESREKTTDLKNLLNILIVCVVYLFFMTLFNRLRTAFVTSHLLILFFACVDYFVYQFRGNEIIFSDYKSIGTGLSVAEEYTFSIERGVALGLMLSLVYVAWIRKIHLSFSRKIVSRICLLVLGTILMIAVARESDATNTETWQMKGSYRNGFLLNFVLSIRDSFVAEPENYSTDFIASLEENYADTNLSQVEISEDAPTIIAIMDESFADLSVIGDLETNVEVMPFIKSMSENTIKGYALSSVFGAKTPNSEWEFLTGNTMAFLPTGSVVYQQYISKEPYSLVDVLKDYGYTTESMHPYYETGWSRNRIYPLLGFDESLFIDDFDQTRLVRNYISDEELFDKMIARFEEKEEGEKLFLFGVTMQNHGGYTESYDNFTSTVRMTNGFYSDVNQYLTLANMTDQAVEKLIQYFEQVDEPVIILFFGDHQPSLQTAFYWRLNGKGLSGLTTDELEDVFTVPFFIWTNYDSEEKEVDITSFNFLSTMLLEQANLPLPAYNQFLSDVMDVIPAMNSRAYYSKTEGGFLHYDEASGEEAETIANYESLQYNSMFDTSNQSELFFGQYLRNQTAN